MTCFGKPTNHRATCAFCHPLPEPAVEHVHFGHGCANLCRKHAKQVQRTARKQNRTVETQALDGQQLLPGMRS